MRVKNWASLSALINKDYENTSGVIAAKHGTTIYERYFHNHNKNTALHIASVTKSISSALIGLAIDKKIIQSVNQKVLDFFPDYTLKRGERVLSKITIHHLLSMTAPYKFKHEPYTKVYGSNHWTHACLDLLGGKSSPGNFHYTTVGIHVLASVLREASGMTLNEFAQKELFDPLAIPRLPNVPIHAKCDYMAMLKTRSTRGWAISPDGENTAGWGLALTARDLLKFGQLYLNGGCWNDRQILSTHWLKLSTQTVQSQGKAKYGYLWWLIDGANQCFAAIGDGGNLLYIDAKASIVVVLTARFKARAKERITLIQDTIIPLIKASN